MKVLQRPNMYFYSFFSDKNYGTTKYVYMKKQSIVETIILRQ